MFTDNGEFKQLFCEITDTNKKAFTYCMSSWMKMVLKLLRELGFKSEYFETEEHT